jgi:predicted Fe-Mo cluster-binding NifX family protein
MKKIAFPTDDGVTISRHLGECEFYLIATLDDEGSTSFDRREKPRREPPQKAQGAEREGHHARLGPALIAPIRDCQVLISGGMGQPAYDHAVAQGLEVFLPAEHHINDALEAYRAGTLGSDLPRIHKH